MKDGITSLEDLVSKSQEEYNEDKDIAWDLILKNTNVLIDSWKWYDKTLFNLYKNSRFSLRGLAKETDISWMSIHSTVKSSVKNLIREEFQEDYEDFTRMEIIT